MSEEHHHSHPHPPAPPAPPEPSLSEDAGSQALADALKSSFRIVQVLMVFLVLLFLCSGIFSVGPQERKVILRFGNPLGVGTNALLLPGLHWAFPPPIDEVRKIPFAQLQTLTSTVGWYATTPEQAPTSLNPAMDGYTLVGDGNIVHARATLTFRVDNPIRYEFDFASASNSLRDDLDNALVYASAKFTNVDDALRRERILFQDTVRARVEELVRRQDLGIAVDQCQVRAIPPLKLKSDFERVTTVLSEVTTATNQALSFLYESTNQAIAEANRRISMAENERLQLVTNLNTEVQLFSNLLPQWRTNPELVRSVYLYPVLSQVMANVGGKWYLPQNMSEIRMQLGEEIPVPKSTGPPPATGDLLQ